MTRQVAVSIRSGSDGAVGSGRHRDHGRRRRPHRMLRGWTAYFKYGCSNATFSYLRSYLWKEIVRWQERKHRRTTTASTLWHLARRWRCWVFDPARVKRRRVSRSRIRRTVLAARSASRDDSGRRLAVPLVSQVSGMRCVPRAGVRAA
jgi:hypothetical protein